MTKTKSLILAIYITACAIACLVPQYYLIALALFATAVTFLWIWFRKYQRDRRFSAQGRLEQLAAYTSQPQPLMTSPDSRLMFVPAPIPDNE